MPVINITNENFEAEVINNKKPILLDFWADWCGPCLKLAPVVEEISNEQDAVRVGKVDVTKFPDLAARFGVITIPLLVLVNDGKAAKRSEGYNPDKKKNILEMLTPYMQKSAAFEKKALAMGDAGTARVVVSDKNTAKTMGSGNLDVFATPAMVALMEKAACDCISASLEPAQSSVGTMINVSHLAASPIGANIIALATLQEIDGKKLVFSVTANDGDTEIGNGTHTRFIIDTERFISKLVKG